MLYISSKLKTSTNANQTILFPQPGPEARRSRQNNGSVFMNCLHVFQLREGKGTLPRYNNQFSAFFKMHFCGPVNKIVTHRMSDSGERTPATWANDHCACQE